MWEQAIVRGVWYYIQNNTILGAVMVNDYFLRCYVGGKEIWNIDWNVVTKQNYAYHVDHAFRITEEKANANRAR